MDKRTFLTTAAAGIAASSVGAIAQSAVKSDRGPSLLSISGAISNSNRGPLDPALDQMMHKQNVAFAKAYTFDFAEIAALSAVSIKPTLEYDAKLHALRGPLLIDVITKAGVQAHATKMLLRAVDGYAVQISLNDARKYGFIVATHLDNQPMPLGGLGPLWAVYDADRFPEMAAKPVNQRFALCPWALYHIDVQA